MIKIKIVLHCFARCQRHCNTDSQDFKLEKEWTSQLKNHVHLTDTPCLKLQFSYEQTKLQESNHLCRCNTKKNPKPCAFEFTYSCRKKPKYMLIGISTSRYICCKHFSCLSLTDASILSYRFYTSCNLSFKLNCDSSCNWYNVN